MLRTELWLFALPYPQPPHHQPVVLAVLLALCREMLRLTPEPSHFYKRTPNADPRTTLSGHLGQAPPRTPKLGHFTLFWRVKEETLCASSRENLPHANPEVVSGAPKPHYQGMKAPAWLAHQALQPFLLTHLVFMSY